MRDESDAIVPRRSLRATGLSPLATVFIACVLPVGAESPPDTPMSLAPADTQEVSSTVRDDTPEPEEVVVTGSRLEPGSVVPYEDMQHVHDSRAKGACLYKRGRYDEAFPYLQAAAKRGFKLAQARVGFLHQQGLGTRRDTDAAVGWLAVAAHGTTHPEIRRYFKDAWERIPEEHMPRFEALRDEYRSKYGSRRHRVNCDLSFEAGTHFKKLTCRFMDEGIYVDYGPLIDMLLASIPSGSNPFPTSNPIRPNRAGC